MEPSGSSILCFEGASLHVRPGFWKHDEKVNMQLAQLDLTEDEVMEEESNDGEMLCHHAGCLPSEDPDVSELEFCNLCCPLTTEFNCCFVLTVLPSPAIKKVLHPESFHCYPVTLVLFLKTCPGNKWLIVNQNMQMVSHKGELGTCNCAPEEPCSPGMILHKFALQRGSFLVDRSSISNHKTLFSMEE